MRPEWQVNSLHLKNFRAFEELELTFGREVTLLIGRNGSGKTTVLDALAIALREPVRELGGQTPDTRNIKPSDARQLIDGPDSLNDIASVEPVYPCSVSIEGVFDDKLMGWERTLAGRRSRTTTAPKPIRQHFQTIGDAASAKDGGDDIKLPVIAYYGVERMMSEVNASKNLRFSRRGSYDWALDPRSALKHTSSYLRKLDEQITRAAKFGDAEPVVAMRQYRAMERAAEAMLEPLGWKSLRWNPTANDFVMMHRQHGVRPLHELPSGAKIAVGLALDIAARMTRANPQLDLNEVLSTTQGIVLVDEIDLHLHPSWQKTVVPQLRDTFPAIQWVMTTHSPQVIGSVEADNIRRIEEDGEVLIPPYAEGLKPEVVLEQIQGTSPEPVTPITGTLERYMDLVYDGEGLSPAALQMREELDSSLGGAEWVDELRRADAVLAFEKV